jgi:hypothetical protein
MSIKVSKDIEKLNSNNIAVRRLERMGTNRRFGKVGCRFMVYYNLDTGNVCYDSTNDEDYIGGAKLGRCRPEAFPGRIKRRRVYIGHE